MKAGRMASCRRMCETSGDKGKRRKNLREKKSRKAIPLGEKPCRKSRKMAYGPLMGRMKTHSVSRTPRVTSDARKKSKKKGTSPRVASIREKKKERSVLYCEFQRPCSIETRPRTRHSSGKEELKGQIPPAVSFNGKNRPRDAWSQLHRN